MRYWLVFVWLVLGIFLSDAQVTNIRFEHLSIDEGLSQNTGNCFWQDSKGLLWIGTQEGLNAYDGIHFKHFKRVVGNKSSLSDNFVLSIFEDKKGNLWVGTEGALNKFDRKHQKFTHYKNNSKDTSSISNNYARCFLEDTKGNLWIGTDKGINRYDYQNDKFNRYEPANEVVADLVQDNSGKIWAATDKGLASFIYGKFEHHPTFTKKIKCLALDKGGALWIGGPDGLYIKSADTIIQVNSFNIQDITIAKNGAVWVATTAGVLKIFEGTTTHIKHNPSNTSGLTSDDILTVFEDDAGIIWVGTSGLGISRYDPQKIKFNVYTYQSDNQYNLSDYKIRALYHDHYDKLWIGTEKGLNVMHRPSGRTVSKGPLEHVHVSWIFEDYDKNIWIGTNGSGIFVYSGNDSTLAINYGKMKHYEHRKDDSTSLPINAIRVIYQDKQGTIWVGTDRGGFCKYIKEIDGFKTYKHSATDTNSLSYDRVRGIMQDRKGNMWISTYGGGLDMFDPSTETFVHHKNDANDSTSISADRVYAVYEDDNEILWVLTYGGGLNRFDPKTRKFKAFTEENGLPNNVLYSFLVDEKKDLWFSTNRGVSKFSIKTEVFDNYTIEDGLQSNEFNFGAFAKNDRGELFFGGVKGINYFSPGQFSKSTYKPKIVFTDFKLFNKSVEIGEKSILSVHIDELETLTLPSNADVITFDFAALHYSHPKNIKYAYKMEGFDDDWSYSDVGSAKYTNLDDGTYIFLVKATNCDGIWSSDVRSITIVVLPAFWENLWFQVLIVLLVLGIVYLIYLARIRRINAQKIALEKIVEQRTSELVKKGQELSEKNTELERQKEETLRQAASLQLANNEILHKSKEIEEAFSQIESKNKDITASIAYAKRIQEAMLPQVAVIKKFIPEFFHFFRPRDIVSGDFYWFAAKKDSELITEGWDVDNEVLAMGASVDKLFIAATDCTGHGVPGAFMSLIGAELLSRVVNENVLEYPDEILNELHKHVRSTLKQAETENKDGMDIALCMIDYTSRKLYYAGANRPLVLVRKNGEMDIIRGDKQSIGGRQMEEVRIFTRQEIDIDEIAAAYLFTDGYQDQFGGDQSKKYMSKNFYKLLHSLSHLPTSEQKVELQRTFEDWIGTNHKQIDDVLVIGFKL